MEMETMNLNDSASTASKATWTTETTPIHLESTPTSSSLSKSDISRNSNREELVIKDDPTILNSHKRVFFNLIYWQTPFVSGAILFSSILFIFLSNVFLHSFLSFGCGFLFLATLLNFVYVGTTRLIQTFSGIASSNPNRQRIQAAYFEFKETDAVYYSVLVLTYVNSVLRVLARLILIQDFITSFKALVSLYALWTLVSYVSTSTFFMLMIFSSFTLPLAYEKNKANIHVFVSKIEAQLHRDFVKVCTLMNNLRMKLFEKVKSTKSNLAANPVSLKKEE